VLARVLKGWKQIDREEAKDMSRMNRLIEKSRLFDLQAVFQKW